MIRCRTYSNFCLLANCNSSPYYRFQFERNQSKQRLDQNWKSYSTTLGERRGKGRGVWYTLSYPFHLPSIKHYVSIVPMPAMFYEWFHRDFYMLTVIYDLIRFGILHILAQCTFHMSTTHIHTHTHSVALFDSLSCADVCILSPHNNHGLIARKCHKQRQLSGDNKFRVKMTIYTW